MRIGKCSHSSRCSPRLGNFTSESKSQADYDISYEYYTDYGISCSFSEHMSWDNTVKRTHRTTPTSGVGQLEIETENRGTRHTTIYEGGELLSEDDIQGNVSWISREGTYDGVWVQEYVERSRDDRGTMYSGGATIEFQHGLTLEESWFTVTYGDHAEHGSEFCPCWEGTGYWYGITGAYHGAPPAVCVGMDAWPTNPLPIPAIGSTPTAPAGIAVTPPTVVATNTPLPDGLKNACENSMKKFKHVLDGKYPDMLPGPGYQGITTMTNEIKNIKRKNLVVTFKKLDKMMELLSEKDRYLLTHVIMTLFETKVNGVRFSGNCHDWKDRAQKQIKEMNLPFSRNFDIMFHSADKVKLGWFDSDQRFYIDWLSWSKPFKAWRWEDHSFIEIIVGPNKERIFFDNGGLGTQLYDGITNSYGGVFFDVPPWINFN